MAATFTVQLHRLRFAAPHGVYAEEAAAGNDFEVNLSLTVKAPAGTNVCLDDTINYAAVYEIIKNVFSCRTDLLETLAMEMAGSLKERFPRLRKVSVQIIKLHPPITAFAGSVSVTYQTKFRS